MQGMIRRSVQVLFLCILLFYCVLFFAHKTNFLTADLGRHITNGRLCVEEKQILDTNFYSYTEPEYPTITHHWGTGVIFYLLWRFFDFEGLHIFYLVIILLTFLAFFFAARLQGSFWWTFFFTLFAMPLIAQRTEIRPEIFSNLFLGVYTLLLFGVRQKKFPPIVLFILPVLQLMWVNVHVFFPLGIFLIGVFLGDAWLRTEELRHYLIVLLCTVAVSFINPFGWRGVIEPFFIFKEYGYMVAENQSILFMQRRFGSFIYAYFEILCAIVICIVAVTCIRKQFKKQAAYIVLMVTFTLLAWFMMRMMPVFGYFLILCGSGLTTMLITHGRSGWKKGLYVFSVLLAVVFLVISTRHKERPFSPWGERVGIGLLPQSQRSATFIKKNNIAGPVFNNYDIGGYFIFHLFPRLRPFVDNRPESYSVSFFKDVYIPMQESEDRWKEIDHKYHFNAIYFYRHDQTPWAQPFLIRRIHDPAWIPVFVDAYTLLLVRNNQKNADIIRQYRLPESLFQVKDNR